jgi:hypothetical protein
MIRLINHDDLEALLGGQIDLLRLSNFLQKLLHDNTIIVPHIRRCDFEMVHRGDDVEFEFAVCARLEDAGVDFDLFDTWSVEFFKGCDYPSLLARAGGTVDEEVREIPALSLENRR